MEVPIYPAPPRIPIKLSELYGSPVYRLKNGEADLVNWVMFPSGRAKTLMCAECIQLEDSEYIRRAAYRRHIKGRSEATLPICRQHRRMWSERDRIDSSDQDFADPVILERVIENYLYHRGDPIRELTDTETFSIIMWFLRHGYGKGDVVKSLNVEPRRLMRAAIERINVS